MFIYLNNLLCYSIIFVIDLKRLIVSTMMIFLPNTRSERSKTATDKRGCVVLSVDS